MSKDTELAAETNSEGKENLKLWKSVEKTPPDMTKEVAFGKRKFTTIDPQWQMRVATALWGPYGHRWGLRDLKYQLVETKGSDKVSLATIHDKVVHSAEQMVEYIDYSIILEAEFFYPVDSETASFPIINDDKYRVGDDTLKKIITNTRSKALSWLGFSADIFLGKFEDASYVKDLKAKFGDQDAFMNTIATAIRTAKDMDALAKCKTRLEEIIADQTLDNAAAAQELLELVAERKRELKPKGA